MKNVHELGISAFQRGNIEVKFMLRPALIRRRRQYRHRNYAEMLDRQGYSRRRHRQYAHGGEQTTVIEQTTNVTIGGDITMRTVLLAMLVAAAIGLAGTSGGSALPVNGAVIGDLANATDSIAQVQWGHWRWGSRGGHWRWGSRGGHWRWGSRGGRRY
jgi:hypothetical protein